MRIRVVAPSEWRSWRELRLRALLDDPDAFGETIAEARTKDEASWRAATAARSGRICLFAEHDGVPIGMCVVAMTTSPQAAKSFSPGGTSPQAAKSLSPGGTSPQAAKSSSGAPSSRSGVANLYAMWVAPEARRLGAGRALIDAAKRWARFAGGRELALRVTDRDTAARELYRTTGFAPTGAHEPLRPGATSLIAHALVARLGPLVMGVVNVTPDSFSDGGAYLDPEAAIDHGLRLVRDGADILDIGGEATNPRARPVDTREELRRIVPVIERLATTGTTISVDTTKADVARVAVAAGATIVNDVAAGQFDPQMARLLDELEVTYIAGHLRGTTIAEVFDGEATPPTWREVTAELGERLAALPSRARTRVWVDPGLGFGKGADPEVNLDLVRHAGDLGRALGCPVVVGPSRKRFLRRLLESAGAGREPDLASIDMASVAACLAAVRAGAHVVRVHNVALLRAALAVYTRM